MSHQIFSGTHHQHSGLFPKNRQYHSILCTTVGNTQSRTYTNCRYICGFSTVRVNQYLLTFSRKKPLQNDAWDQTMIHFYNIGFNIVKMSQYPLNCYTALGGIHKSICTHNLLHQHSLHGYSIAKAKLSHQLNCYAQLLIIETIV